MKKIPIWQKYYICCLACVLITTIMISAVFLTKTWIEEKEIVDVNAKNIMYFVDNDISGKLDSFREQFGGMSMARNLRMSVQEAYNGEPSKKTQALIESLYADFDEVLAIFYIDENGNYYSAGEAIGSLEKRFQIINDASLSDSFKSNRYVWMYAKTSKGNDACVLSQEINYITDSYQKERQGNILVYVDTDKISNNYFAGMIDETDIIFLDADKKVVAGNDKNLLGQKYEDVFLAEGRHIVDREGNKYFYTTKKSEIKGWEIVCYFKTGLIMQHTKKAIFFIVIIGLLSSIVIGFVAYHMAHRLGRPIEELLHYTRISNVGTVEFDDGVSKDEIQELKSLFDDVAGKLKHEVKKGYVKEIQLKNAKIRTLEEQINPHFLYNTLQIIQMLSATNRNEDVINVTTCLGKMLRFSLDSQGEIKLGDEIENIKNYFRILKYRFGDSFDYKVIIDEKLYNCRTVKFLLQPFVENSVKHGFKDKQGLWEIAITAVEINGEIAVIIRDNGTGIEKGKLKEIKKTLLEGTSEGNGIGMRNVNTRIKLYYGEEYGVDVFTASGNTQVVIHIPKREGNEEDSNV